MRKIIFGLVLLLSLPLSIHAQTYWNLEPVWVKAEPETCTGYGVELASGDLNGDGFSDIVTGYFDNTNWIVKTWIFFSNPLDTIVDIVLNRYPGSPVISDVNGDGFGDLIFFNDKMWIYFGGNPMDTVPDIVISEPPGSSSFGCSITSGDMNGDGVNDVLVGAYCTNGNDGRVYIYFGGSDIDTIPDVILNGQVGAASNFGLPVSSGYDVNNDGFDDVFIGAGAYSEIGFWQGRAYIYYGGNPMDTLPDVIMDGTRPGDFFGEILAVTGDLNDNSFADAVVGEPQEATHDTVFIYFGGNPMDSTVDVVLSGKDGTRFGNSVSGSQDVNGDGYYDLVVGSPAWGSGIEGKGRVYIYCGNDPFPSTPSALATGSYNSQSIGWKVASAGDVDGDGTDEIMFSNYAGNGRKVWVCRYTGAGMEEQEDLRHKTRDLRLTISPNPFTDKVEINLGMYDVGCKMDETSLSIYDVSGRLVKRFTIDDLRFREITWDGKDSDGNEVRSGVYFVKLKVKSKKSKVEKVRKVIKVK